MNVGELVGDIILLAMFGYYSLIISGVIDSGGVPKKARRPNAFVKVFVYGITIMLAVRVVWTIIQNVTF